MKKTDEARLEALVRRILPDIRPSKEELDQVKSAINEIMGRLSAKLPKSVEAVLLGSVARGTQVKGSSDIDIFLLFPRHMKDTEIERKGLEIGKSIVKRSKNESYIVKYAEHPYTKIFIKDLSVSFDIVPAYKIENARERGTAVDRTQLHNEFVTSSLTEKQRDDVRALKVFLKSHRIYGAEARTEGFSGYLCELLTCHYGSFANVIDAMANAKLPLVINIRRPKTDSIPDPGFQLKIFGKRFIVVDPTDSNRNVAANVSEESFFRLVLSARALISNPSPKTFFGSGVSDTNSSRKLSALQKSLGYKMYSVAFDVPDIAVDIIWQQLRKLRLRISDLMAKEGFRVAVSLQEVAGRRAMMCFFIENDIQRYRKVPGPRIDMADSVGKFMEAHRGSMMSIEDGRIFAMEQSKYGSPEELIRGFLKGKRAEIPGNLRGAAVYRGALPESLAKMAYIAFMEKFSI